MFDIEYKGGNSIVISTKWLKLVSDPKLSLLGAKDVNIKGMVEIATEPRFLTDLDDTGLAIEGPGEYEIGDFSIKGLPARRHIDDESSKSGSTIYRVTVKDVSIVLLGNIAPNLSDDQLESIGVVDIVIIPVGGGGYTLDGSSAARLVRQVDPKIVIPVHYADTGLKYEVPQDGVEVFTSELGVPIEEVEKYKLKSAAALPAVLTTVKINRT